MPPSGDRSRAIRALPRPYWLSNLFRVLAVLALAASVAAIVLIWTYDDLTRYSTRWKLLATVQAAVAGVITAALFWGVSLVLQYAYHTALNIRIAERRHLEREAAPAEMAEALAASSVGERMVSLLEEINENTLLAEPEKSRKRVRMEESRRERMKAEARQLIAATKWPAARIRIEDLKALYGDDDEVKQLAQQLDAAMKEHREIEIMTIGEQVQSYISLGLWDKARQTARQLAAKYPDDPGAQKLRDVVRLEEEENRKDDRLRLYREIEHLVARRHYRDARKVTDALIDQYPDSAEAAALRGQMEELTRNADIETRREMESQIIEHRKQNHHKEAYEVAKLLMEQYPESPQAIALQDQIDRLRELAGGD